MKHVFTLLVALLVLIWPTPSLAQAGVGMVTDVPASGELQLNATRVVFDLDAQGYPAESFPANYRMTLFDDNDQTVDGPIEIDVFGNIGWSLNMTLTEGLTSGDQVIPTEQLSYSTNGGESWRTMAADTESVVSGSGEDTVELELRLSMNGNELPGRYQGLLTFTLVSQ